MSTQAVVPPGGTVPDARKELLETRYRSYYTKDVAFIRAAETYDTRGRRLGLGVIILTTIVGTTAFASLKDDPSTAAKVTVVVISLLAATAAAIREYEGYEKRAAEAGTAAKSFRKLRYQTSELLVALLRGASDKEVTAGIAKLDAEALDVKEPSLPRGSYDKAAVWVEEHLKKTAGGAAEVF